MSNTYYLGFDIGGTNARCSLIKHADGEFKILSSQKHSIRGTQSVDDVVLVIKHVTEHIPQEHNINPTQIKGIGIAIAGQIDIDEHTIINAPNLNWHHVNFYQRVKDTLDETCPDADIKIANDLNAIAWGEYHFGAGHNTRNMLAVYVGTGIGAGVIIDGKLMLGADNVSGEIGHCKFPHFHDLPCGCGQTGCIEAYAGGKAIEYRILHDINTSKVSRSELGLQDDEHPTARCIERDYRQSEYAKKFWDDTALALGMLIANAIAILNPNSLLLGGGVLEGCPELLTLVIGHVMELAPRAATSKLQLIKPTLHDDAGTLGAALLCLKD